jgi:ABC-type lipoprotein export system ATPase subunit
MEHDTERDQLAYAQALVDWGDVGGYEAETLWDTCTVAALGVPYEKAQWRSVSTLSGGEQKRSSWRRCCAARRRCCCSTNRTTTSTCPASAGSRTPSSSHPRPCCSSRTTESCSPGSPPAVATLEPGAAGSTLWVHPGPFGTYAAAREDRNSRLEELRRRWDEEHAKLKALVVMYRQKAAYNSDMAPKLQAAETRLRRFVEAGPPEAVPVTQRLRMRLTGGRTAKRAIVCDRLELTGLMAPFDAEIWFGERLAVLGSNGSGKSHFLRLLACGGSDPDVEHRPVGDTRPEPVRHTGSARLGARVRPGWFAQTHHQPALLGRTLAEILHRGDEHRDGRGREEAAKVLDRYGLAKAAEQTFESLSGGQQARFQILLLELSGATLLLLDEPTDNLDLDSAEALEAALDAFEGTVVAVTHDRWFARGFDRFFVFRADGRVVESVEPVWDEGRVQRAR